MARHVRARLACAAQIFLHDWRRPSPLAIVMIGNLITSTLLALPTFYELVHRIQTRMAARRGGRADGSA